MSEEDDVNERIDGLLAAHDAHAADPVAFLGAQYDAGLAWVSFPLGFGGIGASPLLQKHVNRRLADAGAPSGFARNPLGYGMGGPTVMAHGTDAQKQRLLRPLFTGEEIWCQLFSEPGAGSDLAGLATRAVEDGSEWIVNGQKVWTSWGHVARWGMLVARTDADLPKHRGLCYFVCDMTAPGIEVRPLRQLTGQAEFNEVYLTDVRLSGDLMLGGPGDGWSVALTTLNNERYMLSEGLSADTAMASALRLWSERADRMSASARVLRGRLLEAYTAVQATRLTTQRAEERRERGEAGPEGAVAKLATAQLNRQVTELCVDLLGAGGMLYGSYDVDHEATLAQVVAAHGGTEGQAFLRARANTIEGGSSEILRNILGERVLGLPADVRVDKDVPWSALPRN